MFFMLSVRLSFLVVDVVSAMSVICIDRFLRAGRCNACWD